MFQRKGISLDEMKSWAHITQLVGARGWDLDPHAFPGWVGMGVPWSQRVRVDPDMGKGRVRAAVIL